MKAKHILMLLLLAALAWGYRTELAGLVQRAAAVRGAPAAMPETRLDAEPVQILTPSAPAAAAPTDTPAILIPPPMLSTWEAQPGLDSVDLTNGQAAALDIVPGTGGSSLTPGQLANCAYGQSAGRRVNPQCPANAAELLGQGR